MTGAFFFLASTIAALIFAMEGSEKSGTGSSI
jgi:hypothetical protein